MLYSGGEWSTQESITGDEFILSDQTCRYNRTEEVPQRETVCGSLKNRKERKKKKRRRRQRLHRSSCVSSTFIFYSIALLGRDPSGDYPSASDDPAPLFYWGLSVLCAVRKAMPWVLKWVLRSVALSNRRPHTLQLRFPSPSSPCA